MIKQKMSKYSLKRIFLEPARILRYLFKPKPLPPLRFFEVIRFFGINFLIATLVVVVFHWNEDLLFFKEKKDLVLDWVMYWHSDFVPIVNNEDMQRMALFEIDEEAFRQWGSPVITPRDKLKALIEKAVKGGANVIAVDLELSWWGDGCIHAPGKTSACPSLKDSRADDELAAYLHKLNEREDANAPIIILTRVYRYPLKKGLSDKPSFREPSPSFLDKTLIAEKNVFWASTFFEVDDDRVRRRWQLASLVCGTDERLGVVPSMQLLMALAQLYTNDEGTREAAKVIRDFKKRLNQWANALPCDARQGITIPHLCQQQNCPDLTIQLPQKKGISEENHIVNLAGGRETERVIYRFAPPDNPVSNQLSLIYKESALDVLASGADVENQIVFIGVTHSGSGDLHPVPIRYKEVDGVYVVANAVDTLLRFGQFQLQPWLGKLFISIGVIILASVIFTLYGIVMAFFMTTLLVGFALFLWSGQALHHGIGVDMALPMLFIQIIQLCKYAIESFSRFVKGKTFESD